MAARWCDVDRTEHAPGDARTRGPSEPRLAAKPGTGAARHANPQVVHLDRTQWESSVRQFRDYSYRQSWAYGVQLASRRGATTEHVAIRCGGDTIGLADVRIKRLPLIGGGLAFISGGPLVRGLDGSEDDLARFDLAIEALVREFVHRRGLTLRVVAPRRDRRAQSNPSHNGFDTPAFGPLNTAPPTARSCSTSIGRSRRFAPPSTAIGGGISTARSGRASK